MGDNISRQAVIDALYKCRFWSVRGLNVVIEFDDAYDAVCNLQSTDRKGHWTQKDYYDMDWNVYECDQCGEPWQLETGTPKDNNMNFCPHCGADMRGGEVE